MKWFIVAIFLISCGGEEPAPRPLPAPRPPVIHTPDPYCGDGFCDPDFGETKYNCEDCGLDPYTGCPYDGGTCGDGICCGDEDERTCWNDCRPVPFRPQNPKDPGWIDPIPGYGK